MLYYLFEFLKRAYDIPGLGAFKYITTRSAAAAVTSLIVAFYFGPKIIAWLKKNQIGELKKVEAPQTHWTKEGTPTMGGIIIVLAIVVPVVLWADILSVYIWIILAATLWLFGVGLLDDYLKVIKKYRKGLIERYKLILQFIIGLIVGLAVYFAPEFEQVRTETTLPFFKNLNLDFSEFYIPVVIFIIMGTANAVNLTDGLDGLAAGTVAISMLTLAIFSYVTGNVVYADYLNIIYLAGSGELTVFCAAAAGATLGFLWFNSYPAQVFMGDTGSLALGGALGTLAVLVKKELLLPILGGIFFAETLSVIIQRAYFKYTKKKYGEGRRVFKMAPLHHHFELLGWPEPKIVVRFYIIAIILAIVSLTTFKIR
ncbi:MAG: phospho-N-acetylmuramoyl-pentapeptide-transferase [Ignavibacteria bacterium]|nr:phospho-N-acetylmuramoyl-pentapeptide-transferase [Ignavibacteria bacterium]